MNPKQTLRCITITLFFCLPFSFLFAQERNDDNTLHIPPKLRLEVSNDSEALEAMFTGKMNSESLGLSHKLSIKNRAREESLALLPMIFFDPGSSTIPERYRLLNGRMEVDDYRDGQAISPTLSTVANDQEKYYEILNILGYRMSHFPKSTISLEGGYSTEPGENATIARERAEIVKEYLQEVWHISSKRITLLPPRQMCDSVDNILKQEEARRAIVHTNEWNLLRPVHYQRISTETTVLFIAIYINHWMEPNDISEIELVIASGEDVLSATKLPVKPDSSLSGYYGLWVIPRMIDNLEPHITTQAFVRTQNGKVRRSNMVQLVVEKEWVNEAVVNFDPEDPFLSEDEDRGLYTGSISFFESGDTAIGGVQELMLEQRIQQISSRLAEDPKEKWELSITASGEISDNPVANDAELWNRSSSAPSEKEFINSLFRDPSFQIPIWIFPFAPGADIDGEEMTSLFTEGMAQEITQTWFGERSEEIVEQMEKSKANRNSLSDYEVNLVDSFLVRRANSVQEWLRHRLDSTQEHLLTVSSQFWNPLEFKQRPEERFYKREVKISMSPYDLIVPEEEWDPFESDEVIEKTQEGIEEIERVEEE